MKSSQLCYLTSCTLQQIRQQADQKATWRTATVHCNRLRSIHRARSVLIPQPYAVTEDKETHTHIPHEKHNISNVKENKTIGWKFINTRLLKYVNHRLMLPTVFYFLCCHRLCRTTFLKVLFLQCKSLYM